MLSVKNVSKIYKLGKVEVHALSDVSFNIKSGMMVGLMGKSGSGKTTLIRQLSLIDKPNNGEITIDDQDVINMSESKRSKLRLNTLGYVFQEYALIPELTALENVYLPAMMLGSNSREYKKRAKALLTAVGLSGAINHLPKELSGGEQQRVAIARAMVNNPKIIFADEPTANLDSISAKTVMDTLSSLNKDTGVTIIFVSHDPDDKKYADQLIFLKDGKLTENYE
ncbi:MAG TPA: ABC transporter ATP-binding protein [Candidatus Saccharimonadales bacterium]|nr:ABC transporter ATP-binding protein [Candidatus Saccharimonadales bacterium]